MPPRWICAIASGACHKLGLLQLILEWERRGERRGTRYRVNGLKMTDTEIADRLMTTRTQICRTKNSLLRNGTIMKIDGVLVIDYKVAMDRALQAGWKPQKTK